MRLFVWVFVLLSTLNLAFAAESQPPKVKSIKIKDTGLSIEFDRPMQTWLGVTDANSIKISPAVDCQWSWDDDTELECSTDKKQRQFRGANRYQVSIGEGFLSQEGVALAPTMLNVESDLPEIDAYINEWKDNLPSIRIRAYQPASADAIQKVLTINLNSKLLAYRLEKVDNQEHGGENYVAYQLLYDSGGVVDGLLDVRVKPGLQSEYGPIRGKQDNRLLIARINESFLLRSITCQSKHGYRDVTAPKDKPGTLVCNPLSDIDLAFSRKISDASLEQIRKSLPDGFTIAVSEMPRYGRYDNNDKERPSIAPDQVISLSSKKAAVQYLFSPENSFVSMDGYPLVKTQPILFDIEDHMSSVEVKPGVIVQLPRDENLPKLGVMNPKINTTQIVQLGISDRTSEKRSSLKLKNQKNQEDSPFLPKPIKQVQDRGGLLLAGSEQIFDLNYGIAYVPFNVLSYQSGNEILVWAT
ncbi:MAG: hypothetical protein ACREO2_01290, partial [Arenimonas sp.]